MLYIIVTFELLLAFCYRKSKTVSGLIIVTLIFIIGFSSNTADFEIYKARYEHYDVSFLHDQTEPIYTFIMKTFNLIGLSYRQFLIIDSIFIMSVILWFVSNMTETVNYVLILYIVWPFCRDAVVLRMALGSLFIYISIYFYLKKGKKNILKYLICVLIAGMIHYGLLFFLIMLIPRFLSKNKSMILFFVILIIELYASAVFLKIDFSGTLANKIKFVINRSTENDNILFAPGTIRTLFMFAIYCVLHYKVIRKLKFDNVKREISEKIFIINLYQLLVIPFYIYIPDLWRTQQILMLLNYVEFSYYFQKPIRNNIYKKSELIFTFETLGYSFIYLFIIVLKTEQFDTVFRALFEYNILI